ncbi:MAG TPA: acyltransferase [Pseudonocardiaceae bacterium]|nr:acyltransferase [Pseudonocardiaceae bacterium]
MCTALPAVMALRIVPPTLAFVIHAVYPVTPGVPLDPATPFADPGLMGFLLWFLGPACHVGVSFFFLLSGFILTCTANTAEPVTAYWRRRLVGLLPSHFVTWALSMVLFAGAHTPYFGLPNLLLINAYFPQAQFWGGANWPAWRLCAELLFYLSFPLLAVPLRRIPRRWLWPAAAGMVAGMAGVCLFAQNVVSPGPTFADVPMSLPQFWFIVFFPPVRVFEFGLGMIIARIVLAGRWPSLRIGGVLALLPVGYAAALLAGAPYNLGLTTVVPIALLVGTVAAANRRGRRTLAGSRPMVWLGKVAFGFYMTHALVLFYMRPAVLGNAEFGVTGGTVLLVCLLTVNVFAGWVLSELVEVPMRRRLCPDSPPADSTPGGARFVRPVSRSTEVTMVR